MPARTSRLSSSSSSSSAPRCSRRPDSLRSFRKPKKKRIQREQSKNIEVSITPTSIVLNGSPLQLPEFYQRLTAALKKKTRDADRIVVVKSAPNTPYPIWIRVSQLIEQAGGILTLELESERVITVE